MLPETNDAVVQLSGRAEPEIQQRTEIVPCQQQKRLTVNLLRQSWRGRRGQAPQRWYLRISDADGGYNAHNGQVCSWPLTQLQARNVK